MDKLRITSLAALLFVILPCLLFPVSISVTGNPLAMTISSAVPGLNPTSASDSSTTYSILTIIVNATITGKISTNMPAGTTLSIQLAPPAGATSTGTQTMSTTAVNLVTSIPILSLINSQTITYTLSATPAAAPVTNATATVTFTIQ